MSHEGIKAVMEKEKIDDVNEAVKLYIMGRLKRIYFFLRRKYGYYKGYPIIRSMFATTHPCQGLNDYRAKFLWLYDF